MAIEQRGESNPQSESILQRVPKSDVLLTEPLSNTEFISYISAFGHEAQALLFLQMVLHTTDSVYQNGFKVLDLYRLLQKAQGLEADYTLNEINTPSDGWRITDALPGEICRSDFKLTGHVREGRIAKGTQGVQVFSLDTREKNLPKLQQAVAFAGTMLRLSEELNDISLLNLFDVSDPDGEKISLQRRWAFFQALVDVWKEKDSTTSELRTSEISKRVASLLGIAEKPKQVEILITTSRILSELSMMQMLTYRTTPHEGKAANTFMLDFDTIVPSNDKSHNQFRENAVLQYLKDHRGEWIDVNGIYSYLEQLDPSYKTKTDKQKAFIKKDSLTVILTSLWRDKGIIQHRGRSGVSMTDAQFEKLAKVVDTLKLLQEGDQQIYTAGLHAAEHYCKESEEMTLIRRNFMRKAKESSKKFARIILPPKQRDITILEILSANPGLSRFSLTQLLQGRLGTNIGMYPLTIDGRLQALERAGRIQRTHSKTITTAWEFNYFNPENFALVESNPILMTNFLAKLLKTRGAIGVNEHSFFMYNDQTKRFQLFGEKPSIGSAESIRNALSLQVPVVVVRGHLPGSEYVILDNTAGKVTIDVNGTRRGNAIYDNLFLAIKNALQHSYQLAELPIPDNLAGHVEQLIQQGLH